MLLFVRVANPQLILDDDPLSYQCNSMFNLDAVIDRQGTSFANVSSHLANWDLKGFHTTLTVVFVCGHSILLSKYLIHHC